MKTNIKLNDDTTRLNWVQLHNADIDYEDGKFVVRTDEELLGRGASNGVSDSVRAAIDSAIRIKSLRILESY